MDYQKPIWLEYSPNNQHTELRLFCFPYAGGSASIYSSWSKLLPRSVEICAIQLPGRGHRFAEQPFHDLHSLVTWAALSMRGYLDKPFAFFGHSMGALISFELARYFRRKQFPSPIRLLLSGYGAPKVSDPKASIYDLPDSDFIDRLRRFNGTPPQILEEPDMLELVMPILRADFCLCDTYRYASESPLSTPITVFGGTEDCEVSPDQLLAWRDETRGGFTLHLIPGDHFFIHTSVQLLIERLSHELH